MKSLIYGLSLILVAFSTTHLTYAAEWPQLNLDKELSNVSYISYSITIEIDPVYKATKHYRGFALADIIGTLTEHYSGSLQHAILIFSATDGYQATMSYADAIAGKGYIAFKDLSAENSTWLPFQAGAEVTTPAPYYLVWLQAQKEEWRFPWPYQLTTISLQPAVSYYANAVPKNANPKAMDGFTLFTRYCIRCHAVKGSGGSLAPDLINPARVVENYDLDMLKKMILNAPQYFPNTKMPVFSNKLSSEQVNAIIEYLSAIKP